VAKLNNGEGLVLLEVMPAHHRESHRRAGNAGRWPVNGAVRLLVPEAVGDELADGEWVRVLRPAVPSDADDYRLDAEGREARVLLEGAA